MNKLRFLAWSVWILFFLFVCALLLLRPHRDASEKGALAETPALPPAGPLTAASPSHLNVAPPSAGNLVFDAAFLREARRRFNGQAPGADPALPADRQMILATRVVGTSAPPPSGPEEAGWKQPSRRGTIPFLIQFVGPVTPEGRQAVEQAGGILHHYMPNNGWFVELTPEARGRVAALPGVRWVAAFEPSDKIQPFLKELMLLYPEDRRRLDVTILSLSPDDTDPIREWLEEAGLPVRSAQPAAAGGGLVKAAVPPATIGELALRGDVQWIEEDPGKDLHNNLAALPGHLDAVSAWTHYGLTGRGQVAGHADTGLDVGSTNGLHPDFAGRLLAAFALGRENDWSDTHSHGTHTAGSILGNGVMSGGQYKGTAWEAALVHQSIMDPSGGLGGLPFDLADLFGPAYQLGARVHSDSWGSSDYGAYSYDSLTADAFMWSHPDMLLVFSAGNDGADLYPVNGVIDPDSVGSPGTAKNLLTVGALESDRNSGGYGATHTWGGTWYSDFRANPIYGDLISVSASPSPYRQGMAAFSSRGPTDDGRIKPDVVASGTDVISCRSAASSRTGWGIVNDFYLYNGGTSMSTPLVAGVALLVRQYLVERAGLPAPSAALVKGLLVAGARPMGPGQYGTGAFQEIPFASPNGVEGFGQADAAQSVYPVGGMLRLFDRLSLGPNASTTLVFTVEREGLPLTAALVWTDYPGGLQAGVKLVNDYDLTLETPDHALVYPNGKTSADRLNPVEVIRLTNAPAGAYAVRVAGFQVPYPQGQFALVVRAAMDGRPDLIPAFVPPVLPTPEACPIQAVLTWYQPLTNGEFQLHWSTAGSNGPYETVPFGWQSGHVYTGSIPAQPLGTVAHYYLTATCSTHVVQYPSNAPSAVRAVVFGNPPCPLVIQGTRTNSIVTDPVYGAYTHPSGTWVQASAQPFCYSNSTRRWVCAGWQGSGTTPAGGNAPTAAFTLEGDGVLTWLWQEQVSLRQNSQLAGVVSRKTWHAPGSLANTETVWSFAPAGATLYGLAGWLIDGTLWTDAQGRAPNPATGIPMPEPRTATAWYLPYDQDGDGDGLFDWWEYRYGGSLDALSQNLDPDGDSWFSYYEALDDTDPFDAASYPEPPAIILPDVPIYQTSAPPWTVSAMITDNFAVVEAVVTWSVNGGPWQETPLTDRGRGLFEAVLDPGTAGPVTILYRIRAADFVAETISPLCRRVSHYPILRATPSDFGTLRLTRSPFGQSATVVNDGTVSLAWSAMPLAPVLADDAEKGTNGWIAGTAWHLSPHRFASPSNAWYCGSESLREYAAGLQEWLVTPPVAVGEGAVLTLRHWMRAEPDAGAYYYDAGLVRISSDGGQTYQDIAPIGGYPHRITYSSGVPFPPETPCFGSNDWTQSLFDLSPWVGQTVRLAFVFGSDGYVQREGWYIDDVWIASESFHPWLTLGGPVSGSTPSGAAAPLFALNADPLPFAPQADLRGAIRFDHNGIGGGLTLAPFRFRRPAFITAVTGDSDGVVTPAELDLLDDETSSLVARANLGCRIKSVTTNGVPVAATFTPTNTLYVLTLSRPMSDILVRARFGRVWAVTVSVQGPGTATPLGAVLLDAGASTNVLFAAQPGNQIWNLVADGVGVGVAGGLPFYEWAVTGLATHRTAVCAFGGATLTGTPGSVTAAWMRQHYPEDVDYEALAGADTDDDGMEGWKEFVCLTDPRDPESLLRIVRPPWVSPEAPLQANLYVQTVPGVVYQTVTASSPGGPWAPTGEPWAGTGSVSVATVPLPPDAGGAFFRIRVAPP